MTGLPVEILAWGGQGSDGGDWRMVHDKDNLALMKNKRPLI